MTDKKPQQPSWDPFPSSRTDRDRDRRDAKVDTPQSRSPTYRLAYDDADFLTGDETRGVRLQLEWMKPEMALLEAGIESTVVLFGGARIPEPGTAAWAARNEAQKRSLEANSHYYEEARRFARLCSQHSATTHGGKEFVIVTGGGPGVMEAGNRGASDVGAPSIALNITLPHEQAPNRYATPELCFKFHYFAIRKMHFLLRAKAMAIFPGGFGTLDELFEALTLIQTKRMARIPVILFGESFWRRVINVEALAEEGTIAPDDVGLIQYADTAEDGWAMIRDFYKF
ncbi:LOG family protein [Mangrovibrevibacter kandeliae]|uniref:LOG family protein n=1 Tax=Mangrovibrevibacter kandeliae TaxID=2968473 RepID=UPI002119391D|nr:MULTISPECIES: LOG family protein [unclassified Aurantimonas]MCQ8783451.1 LOG family protein [Aurantimonas sp. CSK15Z-1]MCW4116033.1 LOG family protein [Aurantimonas sp. MSK8Z-1]